MNIHLRFSTIYVSSNKFQCGYNEFKSISFGTKWRFFLQCVCAPTNTHSAKDDRQDRTEDWILKFLCIHAMLNWMAIFSRVSMQTIPSLTQRRPSPSIFYVGCTLNELRASISITLALLFACLVVYDATCDGDPLRRCDSVGSAGMRVCEYKVVSLFSLIIPASYPFTGRKPSLLVRHTSRSACAIGNGIFSWMFVFTKRLKQSVVFKRRYRKRHTPYFLVVQKFSVKFNILHIVASKTFSFSLFFFCFNPTYYNFVFLFIRPMTRPNLRNHTQRSNKKTKIHTTDCVTATIYTPSQCRQREYNVYFSRSRRYGTVVVYFNQITGHHHVRWELGISRHD